VSHDTLLGSWDRCFLRGSDVPTTGHACNADHWGSQFSLAEMTRCLVSELSHVSDSCGEHWTPDCDKGHGMGMNLDGCGHGSVGCLEGDYQTHQHGTVVSHHC
jgi:hypothetical protein